MRATMDGSALSLAWMQLMLPPLSDTRAAPEALIASLAERVGFEPTNTR
jgi:hypothetical protein